MTRSTQNSRPAASVRPSWWRQALRIILSPAARISALALIVGGIVLGAGGFITADVALKVTSSDAFCMSCHENNIVPEWQQSIHYANPVGFVAGCSDCHEPHAFIPLMIRKAKSVDEIWNQLLGTISTPEKFEAHRAALAQTVWDDLRKDNSQECRNCHQMSSMVNAEQPALRDMHKAALDGGQTCIDCHQGVAHKPPG